MAQSPPHFIWGNSAAGFFHVIVTEITKKSSGAYSCGIDRGPMKSITILKNISLVVTSSCLTAFSWCCCVDSFVTKIMALTALLLFLTYRAQVSAGIVGVAEVAAPGPTKTPGPLSTPH
ncbi:trem-like transcript 4 protein [Neofelis nebulosa]|uniref:trem-like transcript 4 protein n=1 Tax=Neofelis nebulosa TaxID=61452 RepID=UPI00272BFE45|nr:trem-like transcript 4 protein [Neofelis nebulosa]